MTLRWTEEIDAVIVNYYIVILLWKLILLKFDTFIIHCCCYYCCACRLPVACADLAFCCAVGCVPAWTTPTLPVCPCGHYGRDMANSLLPTERRFWFEDLRDAGCPAVLDGSNVNGFLRST
jgi:hypothetical protein